MRASVCRTESCTRAATSARSVDPDPLGALAGKLPDPGAEQETERPGERAGGDERARGSEVAEQEHGTGGRQHHGRDRQRPAAAQRAAARGGHGRTGQDQAGAEKRRARQAEGDEQRQHGCRGEADSGQGALCSLCTQSAK